MLSFLAELLMFTFAISVDNFCASFAYGTSKVKIPLTSALTLSGISSAILFVSLLLGKHIFSFIPYSIAHTICFFVLLTIGCIKLFDSQIRKLINKTSSQPKKLRFHLWNLSFIVTIYGDPQKANADQGQELSPREAIALTLALSIDSAAAGIGATDIASYPIFTFFFAFFFSMCSVVFGSLLGKTLTNHTSFDCSWLGGCLLICFALFSHFF